MKNSILFLLLSVFLVFCAEEKEAKTQESGEVQKSEADLIKEKRINFQLNKDESINLVVILNESESVAFETQKISNTVFVFGSSFQDAVNKLSHWGPTNYETLYVGAHLRSENPDSTIRYYLSPQIDLGEAELSNWNVGIDNLDSTEKEIEAMNSLFESVVSNGQAIFAYCSLVAHKELIEEFNVMIQSNESIANGVKFYVSSGLTNTAIYRSKLFENNFETIAFYPTPHTLQKGKDAIRVNVPSRRDQFYYQSGFSIIEKGKNISPLASEENSGDINVDFTMDPIMFPEQKQRK